jgi:hypothetical protein
VIDWHAEVATAAAARAVKTGMRTLLRLAPPNAARLGLLTRRLHLGKGQLVDLEGRLQTRQWDDDAGKRHWKTEVVANSVEMLPGRDKAAARRNTPKRRRPPRTPLASPTVQEPLEAVVAV